MMDISFGYARLQKEFADSFQSAWMELLKSSLYNYRVFQEKMIDLYAEICKTCTKNMNSFGLGKKQKFIKGGRHGTPIFIHANGLKTNLNKVS